MNIIVEKASHVTGSAAHEEPEAEVAPPPTTKIIYFMPRSATPFMTTIARPVGQVYFVILVFHIIMKMYI